MKCSSEALSLMMSMYSQSLPCPRGTMNRWSTSTSLTNTRQLTAIQCTRHMSPVYNLYVLYFSELILMQQKYPGYHRYLHNQHSTSAGLCDGHLLCRSLEHIPQHRIRKKIASWPQQWSPTRNSRTLFKHAYQLSNRIVKNHMFADDPAYALPVPSASPCHLSVKLYAAHSLENILKFVPLKSVLSRQQ